MEHGALHTGGIMADDMKTKRLESGELIPAGYFGNLWDDIRSKTLRGDGKTCRVNRTPEGTTISIIRQPQNSGGGGGAATPVIYDGTVSSGVYAADYANGDIHRITAPSGTLSVFTSNIPLGYALIMRVNNAAGATVYYDSAEIIESTETGVYLFTFANLTGVSALYSRMIEA